MHTKMCYLLLFNTVMSLSILQQLRSHTILELSYNTQGYILNWYVLYSLTFDKKVNHIKSKTFNKLFLHRSRGAGRFWLGMEDIKGAWDWFDGSENTYTNWDAGQPSSWWQDAGEMQSTGYWNDVDVDRVLPTVCTMREFLL